MMLRSWPSSGYCADMHEATRASWRRCASTMVLAIGSCLFVAAQGAAQEAASERRVQITLATPELIHTASIGVGRPVVVSRADVESPFVRIRSIEEDVSARLPVGTADPAFKAVLLTPRASTGRPVQPQMANLGAPEDAGLDTSAAIKVETAPVSGAQKPAKGALGRAKESSQPASQSRPKATKPPPAGRVANIRPEQRSAAAAPQAPAPKFGRAEVQAVRAFTRF
jgi:hypothetical protein